MGRYEWEKHDLMIELPEVLQMSAGSLFDLASVTVSVYVQCCCFV